MKVVSEDDTSSAAPTRNIVWDTVVAHFGEPATPSERSDFGKTVKEVRAALGPVDDDNDDDVLAVVKEIARRVEAMGEYRSHRRLRNEWGALGQRAAPEPPTDVVIREHQEPCECMGEPVGEHGVPGPPDPECIDCGGTGIAGWVS